VEHTARTVPNASLGTIFRISSDRTGGYTYIDRFLAYLYNKGKFRFEICSFDQTSFLDAALRGRIWNGLGRISGAFPLGKNGHFLPRDTYVIIQLTDVCFHTSVF